MTATPEEARDQITRLFKDALDAIDEADGYKVLYWPTQQEPPKQPDEDENPPAWVQVSVRHAGRGGQTSLAGDAGQVRVTRGGVAQASLYYPSKDKEASQNADRIGRKLEEAIHFSRTDGKIWFRNIRYLDYGQSGPWIRIDIISDFQYDDILKR